MIFITQRKAEKTERTREKRLLIEKRKNDFGLRAPKTLKC